VAFAIGLDIEFRQRFARHTGGFLQFLELIARQRLDDGIAGDFTRSGHRRPRLARFRAIWKTTNSSRSKSSTRGGKRLPDPAGHCTGETSAPGANDFIEQRERVLRLAIHLVDEGDDRDVAQRHTSNSFSVCGSIPLAASSTITALFGGGSVR